MSESVQHQQLANMIIDKVIDIVGKDNQCLSVCGDYTKEKGEKQTICSCVSGSEYVDGKTNECKCFNNYEGNNEKTTCTKKLDDNESNNNEEDKIKSCGTDCKFIVEETIELRTLPTVDLPELLLPVITVKPEILISEF